MDNQLKNENLKDKRSSKFIDDIIRNYKEMEAG